MQPNDLSYPVRDNVWSVTAPPYPLNVNLGIGYAINPDVPIPYELFVFHDHDDLAGQPPVMLAPHIPDPERAVVTYTFNEPTVVDQLEIIQHQNGITQVEGFVGNSLDSLTSMGSIFGPDGDVMAPSYFDETQSYVFDFDNTTAGSIFQFVIRKTSFSEGYAAYRAFPRNTDSVRYSAASVEDDTVFRQEFNLVDTYGQNPFSVTNAFHRVESFGPNVQYWQPSTANVWGEVVYRVDLPAAIETASLDVGIAAYTLGSDANYDSGAETYLDVSTDALNWTNVAGQYAGTAVGSGIVGPGDISDLVAGSDVVYVRSRLFMTTNYSGFGTSQFLRQGQEAYGGHSFSATLVPEPSTLLLLLIGAVLGIGFWRRRSF